MALAYSKPVSNCFGCSPSNPIGLRLVFADTVEGPTASLTLGRNYESYPGVIHGGIVATLLDEAMGRAVLGETGALGLTLGLRVRFSRLVEPDRPYLLSGRAVSREGALLKAEARLRDESGGVVAASDATFNVLVDKADLSNTLPPLTVEYIRCQAS